MILQGSELLRHKGAMLIATISHAAICAVMSVALWFWVAPPTWEFFDSSGRTYYVTYYAARFCLAIGHTRGMFKLPTDSGERRWSVDQIVENDTIQQFVLGVNTRLMEVVHEAFEAGATGFVGWLCFAAVYGFVTARNQPVAGVRLVSKWWFCARQALTWWRWSLYKLGGVRLPHGGETLHQLVVGSTGTGKTTAILDLLDQIRARGDAAIVFDPDGTFTTHFYRHDHDVVLNPNDARMPAWTPWAECLEPQHYDDFAEGMMARDPREGGEAIWDLGAAQFISSALQALASEGVTTNEEFYRFLATRPLVEIAPYLQDTPAGVVMNTAIERTALSVRFTAMRRAAAFRHLHDTGNRTPFSIREFVRSAGDRWLFLSARADTRAMLRPLLTVWLHIATTALLSLPPSSARRVWFVLDEAAALNRLPALATLMQESRKFGGCVVVGLQSLLQFLSLYGEAEGGSLLAIPQNTLALRSPDHKTAELLAKRIGEYVFVERKEATQYGAHPARDGVSLSEQYTRRYLVEPAELQSLPDRTGYIRLPGPVPLVRVTLPVRQRQPIAEPFMPRAIFRPVRRADSKPIENKDRDKDGQGKRTQKGKDIDSGLSGLANDLADPDGLFS